jgi:hypothetical protein
MDNARSEWTALDLFLITFIAFVVGLAGCGPVGESFGLSAAEKVPAELEVFQGKWKFDEAKSFAPEGEDDGQAEMSAEEKAILGAMKQLGVVMSDIEIRGTQITQLEGLLRAQYDLLDYKSEGGKIVGTALWHEDRHDPGDCTEIKVSLQRSGDTLTFTREDDGDVQTFYFHK